MGNAGSRRTFRVGSNDASAPTVSIGSPGADGASVPANATFSGVANDGGGSGFERVEIALRETSRNRWVDPTSGAFASRRQRADATLSNTSASRTDWSLRTTLPPGNYRLDVRAVDNAGNYLTTSSGGQRWSRRTFRVSGGT